MFDSFLITQFWWKRWKKTFFVQRFFSFLGHVLKDARWSDYIERIKYYTKALHGKGNKTRISQLILSVGG